MMYDEMADNPSCIALKLSGITCKLLWPGGTVFGAVAEGNCGADEGGTDTGGTDGGGGPDAGGVLGLGGVVGPGGVF